MSKLATPRLVPLTDRLRPFVPRLAVDWLRDAPSVRARSIEGTLLFADVSGFTELTEALARRGREGAEEVTGVLDAAFARLTGAAYAYDADLLKFGGDAVLFLFRGENHVSRAATAAIEMRSALDDMRGQSTSAGPVRLQISMGIHTGSFDLFLVGGIHRELVVAGAGVTACLEAEAIANAGEIALSDATAAVLESSLLGERRGDVVLLAGSPEADEQPPPFFDPSGVDFTQLLPAAYTRELRARPTEPEHRHVAIAFLELHGTDGRLMRDIPEAFAEVLDEQLTTIQEICRELDIAFAQTDVSKDAIKVILLAGAPRSAGGEEEELILRATRAVLDRPGAFPVRVGVNTGRVFVGVVGTATRRTYTFYGDAINTAARVMARAQVGQLLALPDVLARARTTYAATPVEAFAAKGKAELVEAMAVGPAVGERAVVTSGPFVGRQAELEVLLAVLGEAVEGSGSLVVVTGEPGIGKTRIAAELGIRAPAVRALRVQCAQAGATRPYSTADAIIRNALGLGAHSPDPEVEQRLRAVVAEAGDELAPWLPLLGLVVGLELPPTPESAALDERFVAERIASSVETLLAIAVSEASLIVVDDAHLMDRASAELLRHLADDIGQRPWLLLVVRRPTPGPSVALSGLDPLTVQLDPLDRVDVQSLILRLTEEAPVATHVAKAIAARSGGNPLFVVELVELVRGSGSIEALPESVEALMTAQIDELAGADRGVLRQASVLGTRFTRGRLVAALELDELDVDAVLARLDRFLAPDAEGQLRFRHGLLRDAAYHGLSFRRRRQLHRRVGESLEREASDNPASVSDQLTHHFFEAGNWAKALRYGTIAGFAARRAFANVDAAALFTQAVAAGTTWRRARPESIIVAAEALGDVRLVLGELDGAREAFVTARRRIRGDVVERARLLRKEAHAAHRLGANATAEKRLISGLELLSGVTSRTATAQRAAIEAWVGHIRLVQGRPSEAVTWFERAIANGEAVDDLEAIAHALLGLDLAFASLGDPRSGSCGPRALEIYEALGDLSRQGDVLNNLGAIAYWVGRWNDALAYYRLAVEALESAGNMTSVSMATFNIGEILSAQGRLDEAEPLLREAERSSRAAGGSTDIAESLMETALLDARRGAVDDALASLDEARRLLEGEDVGATSILLEARRAEALAFRGDPEPAVEVAAAALQQAVVDDGGALVAPVLRRVLGQALLLADRPSEARAVLEEALEEAGRVDYLYEQAQVVDTLARLEAAGASSSSRAAERDQLLERLGIVALPTPCALLTR